MKKVFSLAVLVIIPVAAQPVLTVDDLPEIGYEAIMVQDTTGDIVVDLGDPGGPQTWDYSAEVLGTDRLFHVVDPDDTPGADSFPQATMAYLLYNVDMEIVSMDWYQYFNPSSSAMNMVGDLWDTDSGTFYHDYEDREYSPLPAQMGNSWIDGFNTYDTVDTDFGVTVQINNTSHNEVDAYGTVIVPRGSYEALRYITYDTTITVFSMFYVPLETDTMYTISYTWVAADVGPVMIISSHDGETDPDFTDPGEYAALVENNVGFVTEDKTEISPTAIEIVDNKIRYQVNQPGEVRIELYDALGRNNGVLFTGYCPAGSKTLDIPNDLTGGVYFLRMSTDYGTASAKFVNYQ